MAAPQIHVGTPRLPPQPQTPVGPPSLPPFTPVLQVLYIQAFVLVFLLGKFMGKVFFGQLRAAEMEVRDVWGGPGGWCHFGGILNPRRVLGLFWGGF